MKQRAPLLRLTPQATGQLNQRCAMATAELRDQTRFRKEFDRQLKLLIGYEALRKLHNDTANALLLADLVKEVA